MKNVCFASLTLLALAASGPANAADLPVRAPVGKAPVMAAPAYNWTGCYVGAGIGYGFSNQKREVIAPGDTVIVGPDITVVADASDPLFPSENFGGKGYLGTAQIGCDYQFASNWVFGAFIDGDWTNIRGDQSLFHSLRG